MQTSSEAVSAAGARCHGAHARAALLARSRRGLALERAQRAERQPRHRAQQRDLPGVEHVGQLPRVAAHERRVERPDRAQVEQAAQGEQRDVLGVRAQRAQLGVVGVARRQRHDADEPAAHEDLQRAAVPVVLRRRADAADHRVGQPVQAEVPAVEVFEDRQRLDQLRAAEALEVHARQRVGAVDERGHHRHVPAQLGEHAVLLRVGLRRDAVHASLGVEDDHIGVAFERGEQAPQRRVADDAVVVAEQPAVVGIGQGQHPLEVVVDAQRRVAAAVVQQFVVRLQARHHRGGVVVGAVVADVDRDAVRRDHGDQRRERFGEQGAAVVGRQADGQPAGRGSSAGSAQVLVADGVGSGDGVLPQPRPR